MDLSRDRAPIFVAASLILLAWIQVPASAYDFFWGNPQPQGNAIRSLAAIDAATVVAVGVEGTVLRTTDAGEHWTSIGDWNAFPSDLFGAVAMPDGSLFAVGSSPGIFQSSDQGATWMPVANPSTRTLHHLTRIGTEVLSAVGEGGEVLRSTDGGSTWSLRPAPGSQNLVDQFWFDADRGYILGHFLVRRTTDGGMTWLTVPNVQETFSFAGDVQFLDPLNGWIIVDFTTWRTTNGGTSWFQKHGPFGQGPVYQQEALFLDATTRLVCEEGEGAVVWKTTDDGEHWQSLYLRVNTIGYTDLIQLPGGRLLMTSTDGDLLWSDDSGAIWTNFTTSPGDGERHRLSAVGVLPDGRCFAGGAGTTWLASTDHGHTWSVPPSTPAINTPYDIAFREDLILVTGYVPGGQGQVARTTNGGLSWTSHPLGSGSFGSGQSLSMPSTTVAFVATYGGSTINYVFRTTDAGASWHLRNAGIPGNVRLNSIFFLDENTGFLGGGTSAPQLYKTIDGGASWTPLAGSGLSGGVFDMYWSTPLVGAATTIGALFRTTDGGGSWLQTSTGSYDALDFRDPLHGYANSLYQQVLETTDGGVSWTSVPLPVDSYFYDVAATPTGFLLCGDGSEIFGGESPIAGMPASPAGDGPDPGTGLGVASLRLVAWPNPSPGSVRLAIDGAADGAVEIEIFDAAGRRRAGWSVMASDGSSLAFFDPARLPGGVAESAALPRGVYLARVTDSAGRRSTARIVLVAR